MRYLLVALFLPAMAVADEWDGAYLGGGLTYALGEAEVIGSRFAYDINAAQTRVLHDFEGVGLSAYLGWNERIGNTVFGTEVRATAGDLGSEVSIQGGRAIDEVTILWRGDLLGRVGYVTGSTMVYVGGGLSFARISNVGGDLDGGLLDRADAHVRDEIRTGATFMAGFETRINADWMLRGEISQTDFAPYRQANRQGAPGSQFYDVDNGPVRTLTLGVVFEF